MLRVCVLGEQRIADDVSGVRARSSRAVALVAYVAYHAGSLQARQQVAAAFWPESTDAQSLTNLRRELHQLRSVLCGEPSLIVTARDLCWNDTETCRVDLRVFATERHAALAAATAGDDRAALDHAAAAIAEYRGDLLPGSYDDWLIQARPGLRRQCVGLCDLICATRIRTGELSEALDAARRRVRLEPVEEAGYRTLMHVQADLGDRAGAISTYHHCASVLERELDVSPAEPTREVFQRLMRHARPHSGPRTGRSEASEPAASRPGPAAVPLVGRSAQLAALQGAWRRAVAGRGGLAVVRGPAGAGKTRLVTEVAELARTHGAVVATAQCFGGYGRVALAPVADWLRHPAVQTAVTALDRPWRAEVARLVPAGDRDPVPSGARAMADAWQRHRFFEGLARALLAVNRPLLLVLDNLQWCDQETLAFVTFCLGLADRAQLLVAGTTRGHSAEDEPELAGWMSQMRASGLLTELPLGPLTAADTARLARAVSGRPLSEADSDLLHATTGGFPLYVIEAVRASSGLRRLRLPAGDLRAVLRKRLDQATAPARQVAGLAAAVGSNFTLDLLTEASDLDAGAVAAAVDELWRLRIMREFRNGYDFAHDLLRETAYAAVSPPRRWLLHRRIAQGLELSHADGTDTVAAQLADQYARGGRPERAVAYYRRAAEIAAGVFAHAEAVRLARKAITIIGNMPPGRGRDLRELAVLESIAAPLNAMHGYSSPELQQVLERTIALAAPLGRRDSEVAGMVALWASRFVQGRTADSHQIATTALSLIDAGSELSGPAHFAVGGSAVSLGMPAEGLGHLLLAAELSGGAVSLSVGTRADVHGTAWAAHAYWLLDRGAEAVSASRRAISLARRIGHPYSLAVALAYGAITWQIGHQMADLRSAVAELAELCERHGFAYYREWALILSGWSRPGEPGISQVRRGIGNLRSAGSLARMPYWLSLLAGLLERTGRRTAARGVLDAAIASGHAHDDMWWLPEVMRMRAAYDDGPAAASRLRSAAALSLAHGSSGLLRRCERELAARSVRREAAGVTANA